MKMQHKIVSMVLVLSLLLGSLVFTASAENEIVDDVFAPTAELEFLTKTGITHAAILYGGTSSTLGSYGFSQLGYGYTLYKGTRDDGSDYLQMVSGDTATAGQNFQITIQPKADYDVAYAAGTSTYAVFDIDIATESNMTALAIQPNLRNQSGGGLWGSSNADFTSIISLTPGEFAHITVVQDFSNNKEYIFKNNVLLHTINLTSDAQMANWQSGSIKFRGGFKIQSDSTYGITPVVEGQTALFDNLQLNFHTNDASLASALASGNLSSWSSRVCNESYVMPIVPDLIAIDGVKYNNVTDANAYLSNAVPESARLLRDFLAPIDAKQGMVVATNGIDLYNFGDSEVVDNGDGTLTIKPVIAPTYEYTTIGSVSGTLLGSIADSTCTGVSLANLSTVNCIEANAVGSSDKYFGVYAPTDMTFNKINPYIQVNSNDGVLNAVVGSTTAYYVVEFDIASHGHYLPYIDVSVMLRNTSTGGGFPFSDNINIGQYLNPSEQWSHVTLVGDFANNIVNVYIDGVYVGHGEDTARGQNGLAYRPAQLVSGETQVTFKGVRIDLGLSSEVHTLTAGQNVMFDNFSQKTYADSTAAGDLVAANNAKNISAWSEYKTGRGGEQLPPIAVLSGTVKRNTAVLESAISACVLEGTSAKVTFYQEPFGPVGFYGVGSVDTRGTDISKLVKYDPNSTVNTNGDVVSIIAPMYSQTQAHNTSNVSTIISDIKYNVSGNLFSTMQHVSYNNLWNTAGGMQSALVTDVATGNVYYKQYANANKHITGGNEYTNLNFSTQTFLYSSDKNEYIVFDFDGMWEGVSGTFIDTSNGNAQKNTGSINIQPIVRGASSGNSWNGRTFSSIGLTSDEFAHFTVILDFTTANLYVFKNGALTHTIANGALSSSAHADYLTGTDDITASEFSLRSNSNDTLCLDNMAARRFTMDASSDAIATAVATGNITAWSGSIYTKDYVIPSLPAVGIANGVAYSSESALQTALGGRGEASAMILQAPSTAITVNGTAVVETNGFANAVQAGEGVTLVKTEGTVYYFEAGFKPSVTTSSATSFNNVTGSIGGNLLAATARETNSGPYKYTQYNESNSSDHYYMIRPQWDASTANTYIEYSATAAEIYSTSYYIFDLDVATESDFIDVIDISVLQRYYPDRNTTNGKGFGDSRINIAQFLSPSSKWQHLTAIGDFQENVIHIFVNGEYVGKISGAGANAFTTDWFTDSTDDIFKFEGMRINTNADVALDQNQTTLFDNASVRYFNSNAAACDIEKYIAAGSIANYPLAYFGRMGESLPSIATIDGVEYGNAAEATKALTDASKEHTVSLDRELLFGSITVSSDTVVYTNGFSTSIVAGAGYNSTSSDGKVVVYKDSYLCEVIVRINGTTVYTEDVVCGTDFNDILKKIGADGTTVMFGGKMYENLEWTTTPGVITNKVRVFDATAEEVVLETAFYAYNTETGEAITPSAYNAAGFASLLTRSEDITIVLNTDLVINHNNGVSGGDKTIALNGHILTTPVDETKNASGDSHMFSFGSSNDTNLTILGPGSINNPVTWSQAMVFKAYGSVGTVTLKNLTVNTNQALFQFRAGNAVVENCEINAFSTNTSPTSLLNIGEDYNAGWTKTSINMSFKDSRINYKHLSSKTGAMITAKVVTAETDKRHTLVFDGCEIYAMTDFIKYDYNASRGAKYINSNLNVFLKDTTLVAGNLINESTTAYTGSSVEKGVKYCAINATTDKLIIIENGTYVNDAIKDDIEALRAEGVITTASGVELAKSNKHGASNAYTCDYATVTWENGTEERWEHLSTPTNSAYPNAQVTKVVKSESYSFTSYSSVPFSMKGNLTLGSRIVFNIYVPDAANVDSVHVFGKELAYTYRTIGGVLYRAYAIELAPQDAAFAFDVIFNLSDGNTVSRTLSVTKYAEAMYAAGVSQEAKNMVYRLLEYIKAVNTYFGNKGENNVDSVLGSLSAPTVSYNIDSDANTEALRGVIRGTQLNISTALKFRFNLENGVDPQTVKITVDGVEKNVEVHATYVEVDLHAFELGKLMTVTVGSASATYDLGAYCEAVIAGQGSTTTTGLVYTSLVNDGGLINAIYNYAKAAAAYNASLN